MSFNLVTNIFSDVFFESLLLWLLIIPFTLWLFNHIKIKKVMDDFPIQFVIWIAIILGFTGHISYLLLLDIANGGENLKNIFGMSESVVLNLDFNGDLILSALALMFATSIGFAGAWVVIRIANNTEKLQEQATQNEDPKYHDAIKAINTIEELRESVLLLSHIYRNSGKNVYESEGRHQSSEQSFQSSDVVINLIEDTIKNILKDIRRQELTSILKSMVVSPELYQDLWQIRLNIIESVSNLKNTNVYDVYHRFYIQVMQMGVSILWISKYIDYISDIVKNYTPESGGEIKKENAANYFKDLFNDTLFSLEVSDVNVLTNDYIFNNIFRPHGVKLNLDIKHALKANNICLANENNDYYKPENDPSQFSQLEFIDMVSNYFDDQTDNGILISSILTNENSSGTYERIDKYLTGYFESKGVDYQRETLHIITDDRKDESHIDEFKEDTVFGVYCDKMSDEPFREVLLSEIIKAKNAILIVNSSMHTPDICRDRPYSSNDEFVMDFFLEFAAYHKGIYKEGDKYKPLFEPSLKERDLYTKSKSTFHYDDFEIGMKRNNKLLVLYMDGIPVNKLKDVLAKRLEEKNPSEVNHHAKHGLSSLLLYSSSHRFENITTYAKSPFYLSSH